MNATTGYNDLVHQDHSSSVLDMPRDGNVATGLVPSFNTLFFGSLIMNQDEDVAPQSVKITNVGNTEIRIRSVRVMTGRSNFFLTGNTVYPKVLRAGESFTVTVGIKFDEIGQLGGTVEIDTNEDRLPYVIGLGGRVIGSNTETEMIQLITDKVIQHVINTPNPQITDLEELIKRWTRFELESITGDFSAKFLEERWAWSNALGAEAGYRLTLEAKMRDEIEARVMVEYIARVTQFEAEATARLVLEARFRENEASLQNTQRAYANAFEAEASARLTMEARIRDDTKATFDNERRVYAGLFEAEASERTLMEARVKDYSDVQISSERIARATALEAEAADRLNMQATYDLGIQATFVAERVARSNAIAAEVRDRVAAQATFNEFVRSSVATETYARSTANEAIVGRLNVMEANYTSGNTPGVDTEARARITDEIEARSNALGAEIIARQALETFFKNEFVKTNASIQEERETRSTATEALARRADTLQAQLSFSTPSPLGNMIIANSAKVEEEAVARATQDAAMARRISTLEATSSSGGQAGIDSQARAMVQDEAETRADADAAMATRIQTVEADYVTRSQADSRATQIVNAKVSEEATARSNADGALGQRIQTVEASYQTAGQVDSRATTIANAKVAEEVTARALEDAALASRIVSIESSYQSSSQVDTKINAKILEEANARASADGALVTRATALEARALSAGNLVQNSQFIPKTANNDIPGWSFGKNSSTFTAAEINWPNGDYYIPEENVLASLHLGPPDGAYAEWQSANIPVTEGDYLQYYAYVNNHRCAGSVFLYGFSPQGNAVWNAPLGTVNNIYQIGNTLAGYERTGGKSIQIPAGIIYVRLMLRHEDTVAGQQDGYCWFTRPYVGYARPGQTEWNPFVHGSSRASMYAVGARITAEETARFNADGALASRSDVLEAQMRGERDSTLAARIRDEASARATAVEAVVARSSTMEAQFRGEQPSALKTLIDNKRQNLIDLSWWKKGAPIPWGFNGGQRNEIVEFPHGGNFGSLPMPDGSSGDAWLCQADGTGQAAGGWGGAPIARLDPDKTYRFTLPISSLHNTGTRTSYWGCSGVARINSTEEDGNPYFGIASNLPTDRWHLFVGYIFPRNSAGKTHDGAGVWDMKSGQLVAHGWNFCFLPDGRQPTHRAYQFYTTEGAYQAFGRPTVECVDGSEAPIFAALAAKADATKADAKITEEARLRVTADEANAGRSAILEAQMNRTTPSELGRVITVVDSRVENEERTRAAADEAASTRTNVVEARLSRVPTMFTARAVGLNATGSPWGISSGLLNDAGALVLGGYGMYTVIVFDENSNNIGHYSGYSPLISTNESDKMAALLNGIRAGQTVVIYTNDEPRSNRLHPSLAAAMARVGAGEAFFSNNFAYRGAYILVGTAGAGRGTGMEKYSGTTDSSTDSWAELTFGMLRGKWVGQDGAAVTAVNARVAAEEAARVTAVEAVSSRSSSLESMFRGDTDSPLFVRLRNEESARATAVDAVGRRASVLEARSGGSGNLLSNTTVLDYSGWTLGSHAGAFADSMINLAGDAWHPIGENVYGVFESGRNNASAYYDWMSDLMAVRGGEYYQWYAWVAAHRCNAETYITWYNSAGDIIQYSSSGSTAVKDGGQEQKNWSQLGRESVQAPGNAALARFVVRKTATHEGQPHSYMWWFRPYFGEARIGQTEWNGFVHGSGRASINNALAKIREEADARANQDGALASTINTVDANWRGANNDRYNEINAANARITSEASASAGRDGALGSRIDSVSATANGASSTAGIALTAAQGAEAKLGAARLELTAVSPNGRVNMAVRSDRGGVGVDIEGGNLRIVGSSGGAVTYVSGNGIVTFAANGNLAFEAGIY